MFMSDMSLNENLSSTPQDRRELMDLVERMQGAFTTIAKSKIPTIALAAMGYYRTLLLLRLLLKSSVLN